MVATTSAAFVDEALSVVRETKADDVKYLVQSVVGGRFGGKANEDKVALGIIAARFWEKKGNVS